MTEAFTTVYQPGEGFYEEKHSRFFAFLLPLDSEEEALSHLAELKKRYYDCSHVCYAYRLNETPMIERSSDAGEPSGTAGLPILSVLRGSEALNAGIFVVRYFGGTKLGTGGLSRAYGQAARDALSHAVLIEKRPGTLMKVSCDYSAHGKLRFLLDEMGLPVTGTSFTEQVEISFLLPLEEKQAFMKKLNDSFYGKLIPEEVENIFYGKTKEGEMILL